MRRSIVVVGSLNMDFLVRTRKLPLPGQTVSGWGFQMLPGGKGANQAYAAAHLGGKVRMIGRVGNDVFGERLRASLKSVGVDTHCVLGTEEESSGVALIFVEAGGQNEIVVAPGANGRLSPSDLEVGFRDIEEGLLLIQLECPMDTVEAAVVWARSQGVTTILDPAPAQPLKPSLMREVDLLTPNESEALQLLGRSGNSVDLEDAAEVAEALLTLGPATVILKLGTEGVCLATRSVTRHFVARRVEAVDVTSAGDTFNGALAVALSEGRLIEEAIHFATCAASISVTRVGAQTSIPSRAEVDALLEATPVSHNQ